MVHCVAMSKPDLSISVIVPVFNAGRYLHEQLDALRNQLGVEVFEIVVRRWFWLVGQRRGPGQLPSEGPRYFP